MPQHALDQSHKNRRSEAFLTSRHFRHLLKIETTLRTMDKEYPVSTNPLHFKQVD
jgi:hypothetical protein